MREFLSFYRSEILVGGLVLIVALLIAGAILQRYFKDKHGPWTL